MVRELNRPQASHAFPDNAPTAYPVFYRTYSRRTPQGDRETWPQVCARSLAGLVKLGKLEDREADLIRRMQDKLWALPSGRWLWVGGTPWLENPDNFSGAYNCTSTNVSDWRAFGLMMDLAMMGCGTGAVLEPDYISQLPPIRNALQVTMDGDLGSVPAGDRRQETTVEILANRVRVVVGDSRQGWVKSYQTLLDLSCDDRFEGEVHVAIDLSNVRPAGETLQGFGGVANPVKLPELYDRVIRILNRAIGRQLTSVECCLLIDEAAVTIVAGNIRRCIAHGERVAAISGMKPIQDIAIGELVLTSSGDYRPVTGKFLQGVQEVVEIRTRETSIRCTANHRVAVYSGLRSYAWKYAGELQPGDRLISVPHRKGMPCATADHAWLVGFFIGDGHADVESSKRRNGGGGCVAFAFSQERLNGPLGQKCLRILKGLGYTPALSFQKNYAHIKVYRKDLADELGQYKQPWQTPVIPEFVWLGTEEIRAAFLAGLADADAGPSRNVLLNSNKIEFLRRVQQLALSLGIATTLHERQPKTLPGRDTVYEGCHWLKIRGIQSQVNAVALVNPHMGRTGFRICVQKKNGLSLPHQFLQEAMAEGWRARTVNTTKSIISPSKKDRPMRDANWDTLLAEDVVNPHWLPLEVQLVVPAGQAETFDIEVESDHEFIASGLLVHNSAGMRQFASEDVLGATAKDNLWQQDDQGNWRIDPDRDSLRMANHTRVFHERPSEEECVAAVRKQFYSGEGAIQWAGEAIARSNGDLVPPERKGEFIAAYAAGQGREWLQAADPSQGDRELDHRLGRYGLNPCVTADTWVHTEFGPRQVRDLIGRQHGTYVNGELFSTTEDGFFQTGVQPVLKVTTREGVSLRLTGNHRLLKVTSQTQKRQYTEWTATEALQPGDRLCLHNHRDITPWPGAGTFAEGWLLGSLVGDGSLAQTAWRDQGILRFWGDTQVEMAAHAIATLRETVVHGGNLAGHYHPQHDLHQVSSSGLGALAAQFGIHRGQKWVSPEVEQSSYDCHRGFLRGLFDADGSVQEHHGKGISVRLAQSSLATLEAVQRMLLRLGIAARIYKNRRPEGMRLLPNTDRVPAPYFCQAQHELVIANDSLLVFRDRVGFQQPDKRDKLNGLLDGYRRNLNRDRFTVTVQAIEPDGIEPVYDCTVPGPSRFDANGLVAHNCGEILGEDFHCNLSEIHLNQIDPTDRTAQRDAFTAGGLAVASLLNHRFQEERYRYSREVDPIVGVSFTGLFDFFVQAFGVEWLKWWEAGRPETPEGLEFKDRERDYLTFWRETVHQTVWDYCDRHGLRRPNRCTTVQPSGTKSLLTGASPGWHPPKAARFIRRITFRKNDPVALACMDYGYSIVPSQSDKDETGNLLTDPFDPRCTEWLVEIPVAVSWADLPGADTIAIEQFSALAQFDFYMQVQRHYTTHNTSATIELREDEIEALGQAIHGAIARDEGYISAALLARFDAPFPRLPFEKIDRETYDRLHGEMLARRRVEDFTSALKRYDRGEMEEAGPAGCDSDKCLLPEVPPA